MVTTTPRLQLRTKAELARLRNRLKELHRADPANFPLTPANSNPAMPTVLPHGWSIEDFLGGVNPVDGPAALAAQESWEKELAFYRSPRRADDGSLPWASTQNASDWGIYLHAAGVEMLARDVYLPIGFDDATSLSLATEDLLNHELQHAALDVTGLRLEAATGPSLQLGRHGCPTCFDEEALCHAAVARASQKRVDASQGSPEATLHRLAGGRLKSWLTAGPRGYRDWAKAMSQQDRDLLTTEVLQHDGVSPILGLVLYGGTQGLVFVPDVPLHLVLTPGSAAASGAWRYRP